MSDDLAVHIVRKGELRGGDCYNQWNDPDRLARLSEQKVAMVLSNPLSRDEADPVQLIGTLGDRVIGRIDLLPGEMVVRGEPVPVLWGSSLFVPEQFRTTGMGLLLMFRMQAMHHTIAVCGISQMIYPIYQKLRWVDFEMPRRILLRRSRSVVERYCGAGLHSKALAVGADALLAAGHGVRGMVARRRTDIETRELESAPPELDQFWDREPAAARCHRSAAWLNWLLHNRINDDPRSRNALLGVYDRPGHQLLGYVLVKVRFYPTATQRNFRNLLLGSISDWMIFDTARLDFAELVRQGIGALSQMDVDAIELCAPQPEMITTLKRMGFVSAGSLRMLFKASPASPLHAREYHNQADWRIRPVEGDHFFS